MAHGVSFGQALRVWVRVAALSFGGPAAQIAVMHRIIVEEQRWIGEARFLHALAYCTLLPGPEAQQLATYIGWLMHGVRGGLTAGLLFILPGAVTLMALSWIYVLFGQAPTVAGLFFGLKCAVLAIVLQALLRLGRRALGGWPKKLIAGAAFLGIFALGVPFPLIVAAAALAGYACARAGLPGFGSGHSDSGSGLAENESRLGETVPPHAQPDTARTLRTAAVWLAIWMAPTAALLLAAGPAARFTAIAMFFTKLAAISFGGAYAILAYVAQQAVTDLHWLRPGEMLDGLGLAETTPGPLIMVLQFVGFLAAYRAPGAMPPLLAASLGAMLTTWVTFAPCFLWIFAGAPYVEKLRGNRALTAALAGITAAVFGIIANLAAFFALHLWFAQTRVFVAALELPALASARPLAIALSIAAGAALFSTRVPAIAVLAAAALIGLLVATL